MSIIVVRRGLQGNRGLTGEAAPASITVANNIANVNAVGTDIANVNTVAGNIANVNTVAGSIANVNTVASSIADVNAVGSNIADVSIVADNVDDIIAAASAIASATFYFGSTGGSGNAFTLTTGQSVTLTTGQAFRFISNHLTTGNVTLNVDGEGAKPILIDGITQMPIYGFKNGQVITVLYDGNTDSFQPLNLGPLTGDILLYAASSKPGYVSLNGTTTIGSATSGATVAAAYCEGLYRLLWDNTTNSEAAVSTGRGGSAAADFAANKTLTLPNAKDKSLHGVGTTLTSLAKTSGAATQAAAGSISINSFNISEANLPTSVTANLDTTYQAWDVGTTPTPGATGVNIGGQSSSYSSTSTSDAVTLESFGSGTALNPTGSFTGSATSILHPVFGVHVLIKI